MTISAVITNYNTWQQTLRAVESVVHQQTTNELQEIIIVDDASEKDVVTEALLAAMPLVRVHRNEENLGYVRSVNVGVRLTQSELVLLLDSDAQLLTPYEENIGKAFASTERLGALGLKLVDEVGTPTGNSENEPTRWTLLLGQKLHGLLPKKYKTGAIVIYSCGIAFRREAFDQVGGFDEGFDFLDADLDFSMALTRAGWKLAINPNVTACHTGGGSPQLTSKRVLRFYVNRYRLLQKYDLIGNRFIAHTILTVRVSIEYLLLLVASSFMYSNQEVSRDKVNSRRQILNWIQKR